MAQREAKNLDTLIEKGMKEFCEQRPKEKSHTPEERENSRIGGR